ncbi:hypothetical protein FHS92_002924 [Sphingobium subterraneum]|uniref:Uncharacterized protein n=1 Tax=Sphingobium subterraneum TaxID=627688 RepID=A0A841J2X5_9SPHN|nr:hypothetical protein [Sphingobium subterraneum]
MGLEDLAANKVAAPKLNLAVETYLGRHKSRFQTSILDGFSYCAILSRLPI